MTHSTGPMTHLAILGKSHALWPAVALLARHLPQHVHLTIVEEKDFDTDSAAVSLPCDSRFHDQIGVSAEDLTLNCDGTFSLGSERSGWMGEGSQYFAAPSGALPAINGVALHHIMLRAAMTYEEPERLAYLFEPFRFAACAAMAGKFSRQSDDPASPLTTLGPSIQFDRAKYTALLMDRFRSTVTYEFEGKPTSISTMPDNSTITSVQLDNGQEIAADLFVDLTGTLFQLAPQTDGAAFQLLTDILPFDRRIAGRQALDSNNVHGTARAISTGVQIITPLKNHTAIDMLYASDKLSEEDARKMIGGTTKSIAFEAKHTKKPWVGNLVRMGSAAGQFGPYLSADMLILQEQALQLVDHIPTAKNMDVEARVYNQKQAAAMEEIRDFALLPFVLNQRSEPSWASIRDAALPGSLQLRLDQFKSRGRFVPYENEIFSDQTWTDMMIGLGVVPERFDLMARALDMDRIAPILKELVASLTKSIDVMPSHADYLKQFVTNAQRSSK